MANNERPLSTERFLDYIRHHEREHNLIREAQEAAKKANDYRMERLNELRKDVERDRSEFVKAAVYAAHAVTIDTRFEAFDARLRKAQEDLAGAAGSSRTWIIAIGFGFTVLQIILRFWA